jgi:hypothetical protein
MIAVVELVLSSSAKLDLGLLAVKPMKIANAAAGRM